MTETKEMLGDKVYNFFLSKGAEYLICLLLIVITSLGGVDIFKAVIDDTLAYWTKDQALKGFLCVASVVWVIISIGLPWNHKNLTYYSNAEIREEEYYKIILNIAFFYFICVYTYCGFESKDFRPEALSSVLCGIAMIFVYHFRKNYILENMFSIRPIHYSTEYLDYINRKIPDDEPHLEIGQSMLVSLKEMPRNEKEKNEVEIKNPNTPDNPAMICKINNRALANKLREGGCELNVKLFEIGDYGRVTLEMFLDCNEEITAK